MSYGVYTALCVDYFHLYPQVIHVYVASLVLLRVCLELCSC